MIDVLLPYIKAFAVGGLFCIAAQILIDKTKLTPARILVAYVVLGVVLSGLGIYKYIVDFAGAGATTPLTGFGNLMAEGVRREVDKKGLMGVLSGGLAASAQGIGAALVFSFVASLIFRSKRK